ncbi:MAG: hypothetical protein ABI870_11420 [Rhodanobacter sp.]
MRAAHLDFMRLGAIALFAAFFLCPGSTDAESPPAAVAQKIIIRSYWAGLSPQSPFKTDLLIEKIGNDYRLTGRSSHGNGYQAKSSVATYASRKIPTNEVTHLVEALRAPLQPAADLASLGLTDNQLQQTLDGIWKEGTDDGSHKNVDPSLKAKAATLRESLRRPGQLVTVVTRGFSGSHTDDYPYVSVKIELANGTVLSVKSRSQQYLMLPWTTGSEGTTYAPAISRALLALLPDKATNRERFADHIEPGELRELIDAGLSEPFDQIGAEVKAAKALMDLEAHFKVSKPAYIEPYEKREPQIAVTLQRLDSPANLVLSAWLQISHGALVKPDVTLARLEAELALAQAAPRHDATRESGTAHLLHRPRPC